MTQADSKKETNKRLFGLLLGPAICILVLVMPQIPGLSPMGQKAVAGALWVIPGGCSNRSTCR